MFGCCPDAAMFCFPWSWVRVCCAQMFGCLTSLGDRPTPISSKQRLISQVNHPGVATRRQHFPSLEAMGSHSAGRKRRLLLLRMFCPGLCSWHRDRVLGLWTCVLLQLGLQGQGWSSPVRVSSAGGGREGPFEVTSVEFDVTLKLKLEQRWGPGDDQSFGEASSDWGRSRMLGKRRRWWGCCSLKRRTETIFRFIES